MKKVLLLVIGVSIFVFSCKKENTSFGQLKVTMTDIEVSGFADYQQVNVEIKKVSVRYNPNNEEIKGGIWVDLPTNEGVYDLVALQNGKSATLVNNMDLVSGEISQMRLTLGSHNTVKVNGITYPMSLPDGESASISQSLLGNIAIGSDNAREVKLNFESSSSVNYNGGYQLQPYIEAL